MSREEIEKLLGGYATDTLNSQEKRALFEAALDDQELFDALAKEQALREALQEPGIRGQLIEALSARPTFGERMRAWFQRPANLALVGTFAALIAAVGLTVQWKALRAPARVLVAENRVDLPQMKAVVPKPFPKQDLLTPRVKSKVEPRAEIRPETPLTAKKELKRLDEPSVAEAVNQAAPAPPPPPAAAPPAARPALSESAAAAGNVQSIETEPGQTHRHAKAAPSVMQPQLTVLSATGAASGAYSVLSKGAAGEYTPVARDAVFRTGDPLRIRVEPVENGYAYLFRRDQSGDWHLASSRQVTRGEPAELPASGSLQFDRPGAKQLLLVFSGNQEADVSALALLGQAVVAAQRQNILRTSAANEMLGTSADSQKRTAEVRSAFEITLQVR